MTNARGLVLTAGLGTRLLPLTRARAKAAAPVDGEPLVRRTIRWLVGHGVRDLVLNLHHKPETIAAAVGDGGDLGARVRYSWECPVLGSAGGPRHALPLLLDRTSPEIGDSGLSRRSGDAANADLSRRSGDAAKAETFVIVNGDTLTDLDLPAMMADHRRSGALVTMALIPNARPDKYGGALLDAGHAVTGFTRRGDLRPSFHFIGPQVAEAEVFLPLTDGVPAETVLGIYPALMASRPGSVRGFVSEAAFHDIGTPADLLRTSLDLAAADGRLDRPRWGHNPQVAATARITRSVLWDDVTVGAGAVLTECIVTDGVHVPDGAVFSRCAIVRGARDLEIAQL